MTAPRAIRNVNRAERGVTLIELTVMVATIVLLVVIIIKAAYHAGQDNVRSAKQHQDTQHVTHAPVLKLEYRGHVLNCPNFAQVNEVGGASISCDFEGFYAHPLKATGIPKAEVIKNIYYERTAFCVRLNDTHDRVSCDYVRYYRDHPTG